MPFFHNQDLNSLSYDICSSFPLYGEIRPKRKLDVDGDLNHMETKQNWKEQMEGPFTNPKRLCLNQREESKTVSTAQEETLPGCLKDTVVSSHQLPCVEQTDLTGLTEESQAASAPVNPNHVDMEEDLSHQTPSGLNGENNNDGEVEDLGASMETDFVPNAQQYSVPSSHNPTSEGYCGCVTCKGLKPSPVTGRFHCHCYASWRGMYGIDCYFSSDYY